MTRRIFKSILIASLLVAFLCFLLITIQLQNSHERDMWDELENQARLAGAGVEQAGMEYLTDPETENRITWVANDGSVLYDSENTDPSAMGNQLSRAEIAKAKKTGVGRSEQLGDDYRFIHCYYALRLQDGSILCMSANQHSLIYVFFDMLPSFALINVAVIILSVILATTLSKRIVRPINAINPENPPKKSPYPEISGLLHKISRQNFLIREQMHDLRHREEEFRTITENMQEGLLIVDAKGELLVCNRAAQKILANDHFPLRINGNYKALSSSPILHDAIETAMAGNHSKQTLTLGDSVYSVLANPVTTNSGNTEGAVLFIMDITEMQNREAMRREFTSNVSHELKTPLTSLYGISEMLQNGMVKAEDVPKFASTIHEETGRLITLVGDIIRLSQLDENKIQGEKESVDLYDLASKTLSRLQMAMDQKDITYHLQGRPCSVVGISSMLSEIVYNLVDNAIKYNKDGGTITVTIDSEEDHPVLRVADSGIGIPKADQERIFERFYRVDKSHSREIGGTGLGLSIVKHACVYLGANIHINSTLGVGTTVSIRFADLI